MVDTILHSSLDSPTIQLHDELEYVLQEFDALLALLPRDNKEIGDKSHSIMNMLHRHTDEITKVCTCLTVQHNELERRELLLAAVNYMAAKLIANTDWHQHIDSILARLGKAAGVDRVYIFQDYSNRVGELCTKQIEMWVSQGIQSQANHSLLTDRPYKESGFERWVHMLRAGSPIFGSVDTFPLSEQTILRNQQICSLLLMPIRHQQSTWGFIGFDNCCNSKQWETVELDVLRTAANILGSAINQQRVKDDLLEKERTYQLIMDAIKDGCWIVDDKLQTIEINAALSTMLQRDKDELTEACLSDFIHPDCQQEVDRVISGKATPGEEVDIILTQGKHSLPATLHVSRLEETREERSKTFLFVRDQTNFRKMAEMNAALVESNDRLHKITNLARDAIILIDIHGNILFWNPAATRMFGYSSDEVMGKNLQQLFYIEEQYQNFNRELNTIISSSDPQCTSFHIHEFKAICKDGSSLYIESSFTTSSQSDDFFILAVCTDISERYRAQLALENSEKKYMSLASKFSAVLDAIPDALIELMSDGMVRWANKGAQIMFGIEENAIKRGIPCPCSSTTKQGGPECIAKQTFKTGEKLHRKVTLENGRTIDHRSFPLYDQEDNIDSVVVAARDISQQLQIEATASRTAHLTALGIMAAGVAHEINNPNNFIMLNTPLIAEACSDSIPILDSFYQENGEFYLGGLPYSEYREKGKLLYQGILEGSRRIDATVSHLKEFACQDKYTDFISLQVNDLVTRSTQLVRSPIRRFTSNLQLVLSSQLPPVSGNPGQIEQVIINLLMNAAESLTQPAAAIVLSTSFDIEEKMVAINVRDEGCGIAPEDIKKIMQPFYTTKLDRRATGLGLSTSQALISQHGGTLEVESELGKGTSVTIKLSICQEPVGLRHKSTANLTNRPIVP